MPSKIKLYRCLRSERHIPDVGYQDECREFLSLNPKINVEPGMGNVEAFHKIHEGTHWDPEASHWPKKIMNGESNEYGYILVSIRHWTGDTLFYKPSEFRYDERRKLWWAAQKTAVRKVTIEEVRQKISNSKGANLFSRSHLL